MNKREKIFTKLLTFYKYKSIIIKNILKEV